MGVFYKMPYRPMLLLLLIFLFVFPFLFYQRAETLKAASDAFVDGDEFILYGTLYKKEFKNDSVYLYFKKLSDSEKSVFGRMILIYDSDEIPLYSKVKMKAYVKEFSVAENDGSFDEKSYYFSSGVILRGKDGVILDWYVPFYANAFDWFYQVKKKIKDSFDSYFPGEEAGLMKAMCLGDKTSIDESAKTLFRDAGLSHILAVSGLHISIVGMGLFRFLRKIKCNYLISGMVSSVAVILYGFMVGYSISALRAVIMFLILMAANIFGEAYDMASSWMAAFLIVLILEPVSILNSGFLFSFGAVFGIFAVANPLVKRYEALCEERFRHTLRFRRGKNYRKTFKEKVVSAVIFSLGIQLFTLPIVASYYYVIPVYVMGLNLVLIPLLSVLIGGGLVGGVCLTLFGRGQSILYLCHLILYLYEFASDKSLHLPVARIVVGKPSVIKILLYYGVLLLLVYWKKISANISIKKWVVRMLLISFGLLLILCLKGPERMGITMLSVGQGDGICVTSKEGVTYMIDGGSTSKKNIGKYILKPYLSYHGILKVDYWLISHLDEDHISGLIELLEDGYCIDTVVFTESVKHVTEESANEHYERIMDLCEKNKTEVLYVDTGDSFGTKSLSFICLSPDENEYTKTNENSMALKMSYGDFDMLFTGDMGTEQEMDVLEESGSVLDDVEVVKSAHHGSKNSNCEKWLSEISPNLTLISAGKNNRYGHPSKETIKRMEDEKLDYLCTIDTGQITLYPKMNGKFCCRTYL